ncbi:MAG: VWA domain-containing protein [Rikenellaceae bacterium]|nr:VWA domain-containing protein [Rikenellaceae bacterium]
MLDITRFEYPGLLWLLLLLVPLAGYYIFRCLQGGASIQVSSVAGVEGAGKSFRYYLRHVPFVLRCLAYALLIIALARPQSSEYGSSSRTEGIDIVLVVDISTSMLAKDFQPDRIGAARDVASKFIVDRTDDRIGIVVFAGESYTQCPITTDKRTLLNLMSQVRCGMVDDGTAIGNGLATGINRLRESEAKSKVIILLTDGVNNTGQIAPMTAAEIARTMGVKVYAVGVGTNGMAPTPAYNMWGDMVFVPAPVEIDEDMLTEIAEMTGGQYFRATDNNSLKEIYDVINQLETSSVETSDYTRYHEKYTPFALLALGLLLLEFIVARVFIRRIP